MLEKKKEKFCIFVIQKKIKNKILVVEQKTLSEEEGEKIVGHICLVRKI